MTRIAFTADLHVDSYGSRVDAATGLNARLVDYLGTMTWLASEADQRGCAALVVAGDFTERRHPAPWLVSQIRGALASGPSQQVYLRGNHDGEIAGGSIASVLDDGEEYFDADNIGRRGVTVPRLVPIAFDAVLACIPFLDRHWLRAQPGFEGVPDADVYRVLGEQFLTIAGGLYAEARRDYPDAGVVLVCHQALAGAQMSESQRAYLGDLQLVVDARALQAIGFEAVVAGHLHRHQVVLDAYFTPIVPGSERRADVAPQAGPVLYAGSIERVDFGEEGETKGFVVADVGPGRFDWEFVETPARPYVTVDLANGIMALPDWPGLEGAIVRVLNLPPDMDAVDVRRTLEAAGAFEVKEIRRRPVDPAGSAGGMSESLTEHEALEAFFAEDPERELLVERGRVILEAVA